MLRILFLRDFKPPKRPGNIRLSGGHIKVRDYFMHALAHPAIEPFLYFTPRSAHACTDLWADIPHDRVVSDIDQRAYDVALVTGKDWRLLPKASGIEIIHYVQSLEQCQPEHPRFRLLRRPAFRICASEAIDEACAPYRNGEATVIPSGIPLDLFKPGSKRPGSVLIWGHKQPEQAVELEAALRARGVDVTLLTEHVPRDAFAEELMSAEVFVGFTRPVEGSFLPALEAMAAGCAVVCRDATGNRGYCIDGATCLFPATESPAGYVAAVERLRDDLNLRESLVRAGYDMARTRSLDAERAAFHSALEGRYL